MLASYTSSSSSSSRIILGGNRFLFIRVDQGVHISCYYAKSNYSTNCLSHYEYAIEKQQKEMLGFDRFELLIN